MSVRFTLVDRQLKLFKHGLQALQKIGSELLLEALPARVRHQVGAVGAELAFSLPTWRLACLCGQHNGRMPTQWLSSGPAGLSAGAANCVLNTSSTPPCTPYALLPQIVLRTINSSLSAYLSVRSHWLFLKGCTSRWLSRARALQAHC